MSKLDERYMIEFSFGSFVYLFFVVGISTGLFLGVAGGAFELYSLACDGWKWSMIFLAMAEAVGEALCFAISLSFVAAVGFLPYRWLVRRGRGWPTRGRYTKYEL